MDDDERRPISKKIINLRPMQLSDVDDFMVWASDDRVTRYTRWKSLSSKDEGLEFIKNYAIPHPWFRAICIDNRPIGSISLTPNPLDSMDKCRAEASCVLAFDHWGKGIGIKAFEIAASIIFKEWPHLDRIEAFVLPQNKQIQRLLEKAGFTREGLLRNYKTDVQGKSRDFWAFSFLSSDYHSRLIMIRNGASLKSSL